MKTTKENEIHKATFTEKKTPWYKKAITPWLIIFTLAVFASGTAFGWMQRSDFANEVKSEVHAIQEVSKVSQ